MKSLDVVSYLLSKKKNEREEINRKVEILEKINSGNPISEVAEAYGVTLSRIYQIQKKYDDHMRGNKVKEMSPPYSVHTDRLLRRIGVNWEDPKHVGILQEFSLEQLKRMEGFGFKSINEIRRYKESKNAQPR